MKLLSFSETKNLLEKYGLSLLEAGLFSEVEKALLFARKIKLPVVLKVWSSQIIHRTELGGVIRIESEQEFRQGFFRLMKIKNAEGVLVQKMGRGKEVALGMKRDDQFGPVLMFGMGGVFIEILQDISFRICPVSEKQALSMIQEIKGYPILKGQRGEKPVDVKALTKIISQLSKISLKEKSIKEIDLNPVIVNEGGAWIADFKFFI